MLRSLAVAAGALLLVSCGSSIALPVTRPTPSIAPADTPAADLRTHIDLLFGEHVFVVAKLAIAASAGRKDEFHAYAGLLAVNSADLTTLMRSALGETEGTQFGQTWMAGNNSYVHYLVAAVTQDQTTADAALSSLTSTYVPELAQLLSATLPLSPQQATQVGLDQVSGVRQIVDDATASAFATLYPDVHTAYVKAVRAGDMVSAAILSRFGDKFPGDAGSKSSTFRGVLDTLLQAQAYLMTMASDATVEGTQTEQEAAGGGVAQNSSLLKSAYGGVFGDAEAAQFGGMWDHESTLLMGYAKMGDAADRQNAIDAAAGLSTEIQAVLQAVNDQRAKSFDKLGVDDRAAAVMLAGAGDAITATAVQQVPAKFS
jgi:hypothetical protein